MVRQAPCLALGIVIWSLLSFSVPSFCLLSPSPRHHPPGRHATLQLQGTSTDGPSGLRRRWRRRKKDSVVAPVDKEKLVDLEDSSRSTDTEAKEVSTSDYVRNGAEDALNGEGAKSQCPIFSKTFPRYRIDTSGASKGESEQRRARRVQRGVITKLVKSNSNEKEDRRSPLGGVGGLIQGVLGGASNALPGAAGKNARKSVESFYRDEVQRGVFRWAASVSANVKDLPFLDGDLFSAASFWRMACDVSQPTIGQQQFYLALPETTPSVAQSLCDVLNWYADLQQNNVGDENRGGEEVILRAEHDSRSEVPVIRFTPTASKEIMQQHRDRRESSLPTAEDTERQTKEWVKRMLVQLGICPFTKSEVKSGQGLGDLNVPVANIMYRHSSAVVGSGSGVYELMADTWEAISDMVGCGPSGKNGVSSILLSSPGFDDEFEVWAGPIFAMLETCVSAIQGEEMIGVVCFHPRYVTPDGSSWPGFGQMHSLPRLKQWFTEHSATSPAEPLSDNEIAAGGAWQRRTPHAVINVLRAEQLEAAEGRRSTGELYERNIRVLMGKEDGIGYECLAAALEKERNL